MRLILFMLFTPFLMLLACKNKEVSHGSGATSSLESNKMFHTPNQRNFTNSWVIKSALSLVLKTVDLDQKGKDFLGTLQNRIEDLQFGADVPNIDENDALDPSPSFKSHFYDYRTGTNYLGETYPTALDRVLDHTTNAKLAFSKPDMDATINQLGRAMHFLIDMCEPHHATNRIARLSFHTIYENYVSNTLSENGDPFLISEYKPIIASDYKELVLKCATTAASLIDLADASQPCESLDTSQTDSPSAAPPTANPLIGKCPVEELWIKAMQTQIPFTQEVVSQYLYKFTTEVTKK